MATNTSSIIINASTQKVFQALTIPEMIRLWQFGRELITNWKKGGQIRFRTEWEDKVLEQRGTVLEFRTNELIKYNLFTPRPGLEDKIENYGITTYVLNEENGHTRIDIIQEDNTQHAFEVATLLPILVALKKVVETY